MTVYQQTKAVIEELGSKANLKPGSIIVVGCSTSEVLGAKIGTNSNPDTAKEIFAALHEYVKDNGFYLAVQCCEHLNRAIITERGAVPFAEPVNVVPQPKAGGSVPAAAWKRLNKPALAAFIQADAAIDVGDTLVGMHIRPVAVPLRIEYGSVGHANLVMAYRRLPYVGGSRAVYE